MWAEEEEEIAAPSIFVSCIVGLGTILGFNFQKKSAWEFSSAWENTSWAHDLFIPSTSAPR